MKLLLNFYISTIRSWMCSLQERKDEKFVKAYNTNLVVALRDWKRYIHSGKETHFNWVSDPVSGLFDYSPSLVRILWQFYQKFTLMNDTNNVYMFSDDCDGAARLKHWELILSGEVTRGVRVLTEYAIVPTPILPGVKDSHVVLYDNVKEIVWSNNTKYLWDIDEYAEQYTSAKDYKSYELIKIPSSNYCKHLKQFYKSGKRYLEFKNDRYDLLYEGN